VPPANDDLRALVSSWRVSAHSYMDSGRQSSASILLDVANELERLLDPIEATSPSDAYQGKQ
jgi:hypothetical protein